MARRTTKTIPFTSELRCQLTQQEVDEAANRAAIVGGEMERLDALKKSQASKIDSDLKTLRTERSKLDSKVRNRSEYRTVDCTRLINFETKFVTETRDDTGEVIHQREMLREEAQMTVGDSE
jgi:hypothetical protein